MSSPTMIRDPISGDTTRVVRYTDLACDDAARVHEIFLWASCLIWINRIGKMLLWEFILHSTSPLRIDTYIYTYINTSTYDTG